VQSLCRFLHASFPRGTRRKASSDRTQLRVKSSMASFRKTAGGPRYIITADSRCKSQSLREPKSNALDHGLNSRDLNLTLSSYVVLSDANDCEKGGS
jgi:hypothetical protein